MSKIWFTADTHFGQQRTLELSQRPFATTGVMDRALLARWNNTVGDSDVVFHLGDFGNPKQISELAGAKIWLLPGNYDTPEVLEELLKDARVDILEIQPFTLNVPEDYLNMPGKVHLVHEPENATDPSKFYFYGHIHQLQMVKRNGLNVGTDCHQFKPIDWDTVEFYYNAIARHYDKNVFMDELGRTK